METSQTILITGGLGYIGSHTVVELFNKKYLESNNVVCSNYFFIFSPLNLIVYIY